MKVEIELTFSWSSARRIASHSLLSGALIFTSGSRIGIKPFAMIFLPNSNCCSTIFAPENSLDSFVRMMLKSTHGVCFAKQVSTYLLYSREIRRIDHASHLCSKDVIRECSITQFIQIRNWLHQLNTILFGFKSFINLENRNDRFLLPKIFSS